MRFFCKAITVIYLLNSFIQPCFADSSSIKKSELDQALRTEQGIKKMLSNSPAITGSSQSHCRYDPSTYLEHQQLQPWFDALNNKIRQTKAFGAFQNSLISLLEDGGRVSCLLTLDDDGRTVQDSRVYEFTSKWVIVNQPGSSSLEAPDSISQDANKLLSCLSPFDSPPNLLPAIKGLNISFIKKDSKIEISSWLWTLSRDLKTSSQK